MGKQRPYVYYDFTTSICSKCLRKSEAKIIFQDNNVYMLKFCKIHGNEKTLIATDINYYKKIRNYMKASEMPLKFNTPVKYGCPYDCGLCTDHEQHSCLTVIEITDRCNLTCPICYASSSPSYGRHRSIEEVEKMLDIVVTNEGIPDIVQISGGEPTIHPQFFEILEIAKKKPIRHLMINTNGIKIATEKGFVEKLAKYMPNFEIYLQFDSLNPEVLIKLRGVDLSEIRKKAIEKLNKYNISTNLVVTLQKGFNDKEIGDMIRYALQQRCIRGITFQPTQVAGRVETFNPVTDRLTLTETRQAILDQTEIFKPEDIIPVPCNPDALAMAYALKIEGKVFPLTRYIDPDELLDSSRNTIIYEQGEVKDKLLKMFRTSESPVCAAEDLYDLLCCLPKVSAPNLKYENVFRIIIIIMRFIDAYDFDVRAIKKSCVHIIHKDGRIIPFETMNLFYRDEKENYLKELQKEDISELVQIKV